MSNIDIVILCNFANHKSNIVRKKKTTIPDKKEKRNNRITISFSDRELDAINSYCKKYRTSSRSRLIREAALRHVMQNFLNDYPTLF